MTLWCGLNGLRGFERRDASGERRDLRALLGGIGEHCLQPVAQLREFRDIRLMRECRTDTGFVIPQLMLRYREVARLLSCTAHGM